ncbi:MAG: 2-hydroxyacyl-CoA dehydratase family protein [Candidatus Brocadiaceae bacterium]|nr:2-hydroxyacyl-CoA dehydratase family protein [Candidatus Brocadiaceae bacterium]
MFSIQKFKAWLASFFYRNAPSLIRIILRFYTFYCFFCRGRKQNGWVSFQVQTRVGAQHLYSTYAHPKQTIWTTMFVPSEILFAMGLYPFCLEIGAALFAGIGQSSLGLIEADSQGVSTDVCTFHRAAIGHAYRNVFPRNILQVATTTLCDNNTKTAKLCEITTGKDTICLDIPYEEDDYSVKYLAKQLEDLVKQLETVTGKKMKQTALEKAIELSNKTREKIIEINELRKDPYSPLQGSSALGFMFPTYLLIGSRLSLEFYACLANELREKIAENRKNVNENALKDQIRILWLELKPYFKMDFFQNLEEKQGVKIVFEETNYVYWDKLDPKNPYESLARKHISNTYNGPLERRIEVAKNLAREYQADGIVVFSSWGCRRNNAAVPTIKRELTREGYPLLSLDGDCVDDHNYMPGQFSTRIEGFLEMLRGQKAASSKPHSCAV